MNKTLEVSQNLTDAHGAAVRQDRSAPAGAGLPGRIPEDPSAPAGAPSGPRNLEQWRLQRVADLNARFPRWRVWRDPGGEYRAERTCEPFASADPLGPRWSLANRDVHLLAVHLSLEDRQVVPAAARQA